MGGAFSNNGWGARQYISDTDAGSHTITSLVLYDANVGFEASRSNSIYGASSTVQPSSLSLNVLIKY